MTCSNCGAEVADGMKFCFDCGTPVPQVKKCVSCGAELSLKMKFCPECGAKQDGTAPKSSGFSMGDKNVIAGDVIGSKEETNISGNATIIKNEDQTKQVKKCHICGSFVSILDGYNCPECGEFTCEDCFDLSKRICKSCEKNKLQNNEEKFIEALKEFLKDGIIDANERREIESLKVKYGISTEKANALEQELKPKTEKINFSTIEKLNLTEATEVFYEQGNAKKAYELLEPICKAHPYSEEVLNIYLPVLIKTDIEETKKIISKTHIDILSMFMAEIEIAIIEKDLDLAERKLKQAKQLWQSNKLKYYEAWFYLELAKSTGKDTFVSNAEEIANNFDATEDKLELSYQIKILKNIAEYKGEDTSFYTEDFCKKNNLYTSVVLGVTKITVGKNQEIKTLKEALKNININGTIILEPGVYKEHVNFDKKIKIVGLTDSIMNKSSSELPIIVLDETKTCKITADVEIEGVAFTHEENLSFNNLQNYADTKYEFNKDKKVVEINTEGYTAIEISSNATLKNIALLDAKNRGFTFTKSNAILENSLVAHSYYHNVLCKNTCSPIITNFKSINSNAYGLRVDDTSNPSLKNCEFYNGMGIYVEDQATGTFEGCHIHDIGEHNGLKIIGSATPSFVDCKIHDNKKGSLVYVGETANPSLKNCEVYNGKGIAVENQASGTFEGCHIHDIDENNGLSIEGSATPSFVDCKIHDNTKYALVYVGETANPSLKNCEVYNGANGIAVEGQARGTYTKCYIHDNKEEYALVYVKETANPSFKDCEVYNGRGIAVENQASGTFEGCHIHDIGENNGLNIKGSATPSFVDCKIHDNTKYALVYVGETANPSLKNCEVYNGANAGIAVEGQARGTYTKCYIHNNKGGNFSIKTSKTIDTSTCRME